MHSHVCWFCHVFAQNSSGKRSVKIFLWKKIPVERNSVKFMILKEFHFKHSLTFGLTFHKILRQNVLKIILVHSEGSCLSSETNHARNSVQKVIFVYSKYHDVIFVPPYCKTFVCVILCLKSVIRLPYVLTEIECLQTD